MRFLSLLLVLVFACSSTTGAQPDGGLDGGLDAGSDGGLPDAGTGQDGGASVLQHRHRATRAGLYTDPALTKAAAAGLHRDQGFDGALDGNVYAQPSRR